MSEPSNPWHDIAYEPGQPSFWYKLGVNDGQFVAPVRDINTVPAQFQGIYQEGFTQGQYLHSQLDQEDPGDALVGEQ